MVFADVQEPVVWDDDEVGVKWADLLENYCLE